MKPIELTVQGLQSYREAQRIDFEALCADGIFGIFGPTGSGKSTILDAITLALYGKVERAAKNTQGILNQSENQLSVGLTFELAGSPPVRYRVERSYKRAKDGGLRSGSSRLFRFGEGKDTEVLADKERAVTQKIQDILGLTHDDFTRAVVLPQGKFAEFLSLKGVERRKMLQRLFHLEKYGDVLNEKLKYRFSEASRRLEIIQAREQTIGEASKEAADRLKKEYQTAVKALKEKQEQLKKSELKLEGLKQLWEWQLEKEKLDEAYSRLQNEKSAISELRQQLNTSAQAAKVMPYLEALASAESEETAAKQVLAETERSFQIAGKKEAASKAVFEEAKRERSDTESKLLEERQRLHQGAQILERLLAAKQNCNDGNRRLAEAAQKLAAQSKAAGQAQEDRRQLEAMLDDWQRSLDALNVTSDRRETVQQALREKAAITMRVQQLYEQREEWRKCHRQLLIRLKALDEAETDASRLAEHGARLFQRHQALYNHMAAADQRLRLFSDFVSRQLEDLEREKERAYRETLSLSLAEGLAEGAPCPVCGSVHHPRPAARKHQADGQAIKKAITGYQQALITAAEWQRQTAVWSAQLEGQAASLTELFGPARLKKSEPETAGDTVDFGKWKTAGIEPALKETAAELKGLRQDLIELNEAIASLSAEKRALDAKQAKLESEILFFEEQKQKIEKGALKEKEWIEGKEKEWPDRFPPYDDVEKAGEKIKSADEQAEQIKRRIDEKKKAKTHADRQLLAHQDALNQLSIQTNEIKGMLKAAEQSRARESERLAAIGLSEQSPIEKKLEMIGEQLKNLKETEEKSYQEWQGAQALRFEKEKTYTNAFTRYERAVERNRQSVEKWEERRAATCFSKREDVLAAHLADDVCRSYEQQISEYEQKSALIAADLKKMAERLKDRTVAKSDYAQSQADVAALKSAVEKLLGRCGALSKEMETMEKNVALYQQLESDRREIQAHADELAQLQQVFRGNGFVEFIAEEQLHHVCLAASKRLGDLTHGRYALEVDTAGGFVIRDDANGGLRRPVSSLSGGETFLTSLALALSLSEQIQLRGDVPLQFFFLDEGFGTLDPELLDTVVTSLEKLHMNRLSIGVISHVPELRDRLPRKLVVEPAEPSGRGSRVHLEVL